MKIDNNIVCDSTTKYYKITNEIAQELHCIVCSGQNIASSDALFAKNVRTDICEYAHQNMTKQEIIEQIVSDYGENLKLKNIESSEMQWLNIAFFAFAITGAFLINRYLK